MATWPTGIPDLETDVYANPLGSDKFLELLAELQAVFDTLGINPQGVFGTLTARLAEIDAKTTMLANFGVTGLRISNNVSTPTTKLDIVCEQIGIEGAIATGVNVTVDLTVAGKNGTAFTRAVNTWFYVWLGLNTSTGEIAALLDNDSGRATLDLSHASLAGFTKWRRIGARRTNATGSGNFPNGVQHGDQMIYNQSESLVFAASNTAGNWVTKSLSDAVPVTCRLAVLSIQLLTGTGKMNICTSGSGATGQCTVLDRVGAELIYVTHWVTLDASQQYQWQTQNAITGGVYIFCWGYRDAL